MDVLMWTFARAFDAGTLCQVLDLVLGSRANDHGWTWRLLRQVCQVCQVCQVKLQEDEGSLYSPMILYLRERKTRTEGV